MRISAGLLCLLLLAPGAAKAVPSVATGAVRTSSEPATASVAPLPMQLAQGLFTKEMFPAFQSDFAEQFEKVLAGTEQGRKMERLFPGFNHAFAVEALPVVRAAVLQRLPALHAKVAAVYAEALTPAEQQELLGFANSRAGQALRTALGKSYDIQSLLQSVARDREVTRETADQQFELVAMSLRQNVGDEDAAELTRFVQTPLGKKAADLDESMRPMLLQFANEPPSPEVRKRLDAIALKVAQTMARKKH